MINDFENKDPNGKYGPQFREGLDRPLYWEEMDYNLSLIGEVIKGYRVLGQGPQGEIDFAQDEDLVLKLYQVQSSDTNLLTVPGVEVGDWVWIPGYAIGAEGSQGNQGFQGFQGQQGVQGFRGFQGDYGLQGIQGAQGLGIQGRQGFQGFQGRIGNQGNIGAQGDTGLQGRIGFQGSTGVVGGQGTQGNQGAQGILGRQGNQGWQGQLGSQGFIGPQGSIGLQGQKGNQGNIGSQGLQGNTGVQGSIGLQGLKGSTGFQGLAGLNGSQGNQGWQGSIGTQGSQGLTGAGFQGTQGSSGGAGLQGFQGSQGLTGAGFQGAQGSSGGAGLQGFQGSQGLTGAGFQGAQGSSGGAGLQGFQGSQGLINVESTCDLLELPNDTDVFAVFDRTGSMLSQDILDIESALDSWFAQYQLDHPTYIGSLYKIAVSDERWLSFAKKIIDNTLHISQTSGPDGFTTNIPTWWANSLPSGINKLFVITFLNEASSDYHTTVSSFTSTEPTVNYQIDLLDFSNLYSSLEYFKGIIYSVYNSVWSVEVNSFMLHALAALKGTTLTASQIQQELGPNYISGPTFSALETINPYSVLEQGPLESLGWTGILDKRTPVSESFTTTSFAQELNDIIAGQHDTYNVVSLLQSYDGETLTLRGLKSLSHTFTLDENGCIIIENEQDLNSAISLKNTFTQSNHGFISGQVLAYKLGTWYLADSDDDTLLGTAIVESVINANQFIAVYSGFIEITSFSLNPGSYYVVGGSSTGDQGELILYVSESQPDYSYSNPILQALTTTTGHVLPWRPMEKNGAQGEIGAQGSQGPQGIGVQGPQGGGDSSSSISLKSTFYQINHGFSAGDVISYKLGTWYLADSDDDTLLGRLVVESIIDQDQFIAVYSGFIESTELSLTTGAYYVVGGSSTSQQGQLVLYVDETDPNFIYSNPILQALSPTTGHVLPWRPIEVDGNQGEIGPQGNQGWQGTGGIGAQGPQGNQGWQGTEGIGAQGPQGNNGATGPQGNQGWQGIEGIGAQGPQGNQGWQGAGGIGAQGLQGNQGWQGTEGIGAQGPQGNNGATGPQGNQGWQGTEGIGAQGPQGNNGAAGPQGNQGWQGTEGIGVQGPQGNNGVTGLQGNQGWQGTEGIGAQGPQGNNGATGLQGNQGWQGTEGIGVQGPQGNNGAAGPQGNQGWQGRDGMDGILSGRFYYFNQSQIVSDAGGYYRLGSTPTSSAQSSLTVSTLLNNITLLTTYISDPFDFNIIPGGVQRFLLWLTKPNVGDDLQVFVRLKVTDNLGIVQYTVGESAKVSINHTTDETGVTPSLHEVDITFPTNNVIIGYRMLVEIWIENNQNQNLNVTFYTEGTSHYSYVITTVGPQSGFQGAQGNIGFQGPQGFQGIIGTQGFQGPQGFQGIIGTQGFQGPQGFQGIIGTQGFQGPQGFQGIIGTQGLQGPQGLQGLQGLQGPQGLQGAQGRIGNQGLQGVQGIVGPLGRSAIDYISTREYTFEGYSVGVLSSPTAGNTRPQLEDPYGEENNQAPVYLQEGETYTFRNVNSGGRYIRLFYQNVVVAEIPLPSGSSITWNTSTNGLIDQYGNGATFSGGSPTTDVRGPIYVYNLNGSNGLQGAQGPVGMQGLQGAQGRQGFQGTQGIQGIQGIQGVQGFQGAQGSNAGITTYTNPSNDRVLTSVSASEINAETNLTFSGSQLTVTGSICATSNITISGFFTGCGSNICKVASIFDYNNPGNTGLCFWSGTQAEYDAISTKSSTTLYIII